MGARFLKNEGETFADKAISVFKHSKSPSPGVFNVMNHRLFFLK